MSPIAPHPDFLPDEVKRLLLSEPVRQWLKYEGIDVGEPALSVRLEDICADCAGYPCICNCRRLSNDTNDFNARIPSNEP